MRQPLSTTACGEREPAQPGGAPHNIPTPHEAMAKAGSAPHGVMMVDLVAAMRALIACVRVNEGVVGCGRGIGCGCGSIGRGVVGV